MPERGTFKYSIPNDRLEHVASDAVSEMEDAEAKDAIAYCLEHFKLVEVEAVRLRSGAETDRRFSVVTDDRKRKPRDYSYLSVSRALHSVLLDSGREARSTIRAALINLKVGESIKILRNSS